MTQLALNVELVSAAGFVDKILEMSGNKQENSENISASEEKIPKEILDSKEIIEAVNLASEKTGVRKDFLMGMLVVESNLGKNTGKCTYAEVENGAENSFKKGALNARAWQTFTQRRDMIKELATNLGYDYQQLKVSCNPSGYSGTGGALGIPQFMPDTWLEYRDRLKEILRKENPDPWKPVDGVMAMALKLSDVPGVLEHNIWSERNAAKLYLSGTTSGQYEWYANQIIYWSQNYQDLIG